MATTRENRKLTHANDQQPHTAHEGDGRDSAMAALEAALAKKAVEPVLLEVGGLCSYANYLLILSGRSDRQVDAIADAVAVEMKKRGHRALGVEGARHGSWALLDFGDVIVHVFHHPMREHYDLEGLWIDAQRIPLDVPPDAQLSAEERY